MGFWEGFFKRADVGMGQGFSGVGKGNLPTGYAEQGQVQGNVDAGDTKPDHTIIDKQRGPQSFGREFREADAGPAESNPHVFY